MKKLIIISLFILSVGFIKCLSQVQVSSGRFEEIEKEINTWIGEEKIPSMAVAVAIEGEIVWLDAFGWADKEKKIAATPQTIYALGSLSKSMAATGVMTLVEQNRLSLESSVNDLITPAKLHSYHGSSDEIKLVHILNMSAGIPHGWTTIPDRIYTPFSQKEKDAFVDKIGLVTFPPGKVQHYSNYSYGFLDLVMERISGKKLESFMKKAVFKPLGMKNTYTAFQRDREEDFAIPYNSRGPVDPYHFLPYGGGGYFSTAEDLIRYGMFYLKQAYPGGSKILKNETIDFMQNFDQGPPGMFKIGWFNTGSRLISNGNITGANAMVLLIPSEKMAIVCLANTHADSYADQMAEKIMDELLPDFERSMTREKYMELFGTPYTGDKRLIGTWKGSLKNQIAEQEIGMKFEEENIKIQLEEGAWIEISYPVFNKFGKIEGSFQAHVPMPEKRDKEEGTCNLVLQYDQGKLYGHVQSRFSYEDGRSFAYGASIILEKE